jgi:hypothetical protein
MLEWRHPQRELPTVGTICGCHGQVILDRNEVLVLQNQAITELLKTHPLNTTVIA